MPFWQGNASFLPSKQLLTSLCVISACSMLIKQLTNDSDSYSQISHSILATKTNITDDQTPNHTGFTKKNISNNLLPLVDFRMS